MLIMREFVIFRDTLCLVGIDLDSKLTKVMIQYFQYLWFILSILSNNNRQILFIFNYRPLRS
jgi:hypothetical protein